MDPEDLAHLVQGDGVLRDSGHGAEEARHQADHARAIKAGTVTVNCYGEGDISTPFGGYKQSGNGREKGVWGLHDYLEIKAITGYAS